MKRFVFLAVVAATLCGCPDATVRPVIDESFKSYMLGEVQDAYVGQAIIRVKHRDMRGAPIRTFTSKNAFSVTSRGGGMVNYPPGSVAEVESTVEYDEDIFYVVQLSPALPNGARLLVSPDSYYEGDGVIGNTELFQPCGKLSPICVKPNSIEFVPAQMNAGPVIRGNFELIYSGATKDAINLLYREYTEDDLARGAFTQNLTYDRASPVIRFRNFQVRVLEANNQMLRYVVEADGTPSRQR